MITLIISSIVAGCACATLMVATHLLLWRKDWRLTRPQAYTVGVSIIGIVLTIWALLMDNPESIIAFWAITGIAGAADIVAWWIRGRLDQIVDGAEDVAFKRGQIVGLDGDTDLGSNETR